MCRAKWLVLILIGVSFLGCGPDTIFVRPGLDTPSQHVSNGHQLLSRGKIDDACREFSRAKELDPNYTKAYVGLGVALGQKGDIDAGFQTMTIAEKMAGNSQDVQAVQKGFEQLHQFKRLKQGSKPTE